MRYGLRRSLPTREGINFADKPDPVVKSFASQGIAQSAEWRDSAKHMIALLLFLIEKVTLVPVTDWPPDGSLHLKKCPHRRRATGNLSSLRPRAET